MTHYYYLLLWAIVNATIVIIQSKFVGTEFGDTLKFGAIVTPVFYATNVLWLIAMARGAIAITMPFMMCLQAGLYIGAVTIGSILFLGDKINFVNCIGGALVITGIFLLAK